MRKTFEVADKKELTQAELGPVAVCCGLTTYWKAALFKASVRNKCNRVTCDDITTMWTNIASRNHDQSSKFVHLLAKRGRSYLEFEDFVPLLQVSDGSSQLATFISYH